MNVEELLDKLLSLNIVFDKRYFKPSKTEIEIFEQMIVMIEEKPNLEVKIVSNDIPLKKLSEDKLKELPKF